MARLPARALDDISLTENEFRADFEITDKSQVFSAEIVRLSLLGIAGYGFLLANVAMNAQSPPGSLERLAEDSRLLGTGVVSLGLSTACSLAHRFFSTGCPNHQLTILRLLKRRTNEGWTAADQQINAGYLASGPRSDGTFVSVMR